MTSATKPVSARPASVTKLGKHQARMGYLFIMPTMLLFAVFMVIPVVMALYLSFTNYDVLSSNDWVGMDNYRRLIGDDLYWKTFVNVML
ncbi:carbohydrate ABC transporter permease, partial [Peribacillus sp. NPDC056705]|uniref:carbohydrate ABC transporter permease n=1 Tax=Peribacillus sp. NPDC056705 TaxID=3345918 RepID=UPI003747F639